MTITWSIGLGRPSKNCPRRSKSVASNAAVFRASTRLAVCYRRRGRGRSGSLWPLRGLHGAVSRAIPELPPISITICPAGSDGRDDGDRTFVVVVAGVIVSRWTDHIARRAWSLGRVGRIRGHAAVMPRFVPPGCGLLHGYPDRAGWRAAPICLSSALRVAT